MRISGWSSDVCSSDLRWLGLSPEEREATAVFASGRDARETINKRIQAGLIAEGSVKGEALQITVYDRVNTTREELRYASSYTTGQNLVVGPVGEGGSGSRADRQGVQ